MKKENNPFEEKQIAEEWIAWVENSTPEGSRKAQIYPLVKEWLLGLDPKKVVDIGAGQGIVSEYMPSGDIEYIGVEPSKSLVDRARNLYKEKNRKFIVGNAYDLPINNDWADAAFSVYVWMHLEDLSKASQELARVLRPGGGFLIITANPGTYNVWESFYSEANRDGIKIEGKVSIRGKGLSKNTLYLHPKEDILKTLEENGLIVEEVKTFGYEEEHDDSGLHISIRGRKLEEFE